MHNLRNFQDLYFLTVIRPCIDLQGGVQIWLSSSNRRSALISLNYEMVAQFEGQNGNLCNNFDAMQLEDGLSFLAT